MRFILAALCLSLACLPAARADDPYTIKGVAIDATASNALEAQTAAMRQGQLAAARRLIERLTLAEDRAGTSLELDAHLSETGEMVSGLTLDEAIIAEMIAGLEISNEQRSATRYLAQLDVSFDPRAVGRVMRAYGVPYVESQSRPMLVLPVMETETGFALWEANPWRAAWSEQDFSHSLTPISLPPQTSLSTALPITARQALQLDEDALRNTALMYGFNRIAVLRAGERDGIRRFGGYLVSFDAAGVMSTDTWGPQIVYGGWRDAAQAFVTDREDDWKRRSVVRDFETTSLRVTVLYGGLDEWRRLQTALSRASLVEGAQLDALSRDGARMNVDYRGDFAQLVSELAERGATLEEHPGLGWVVLSAR
ncbi:hypothetical protein AWH62_03860 [Maricaulis sp. W15]|uniref:DUF2066 domain-containing protein n=1 Tax=Maricaulis sp. W15 TaxID=1772333 RepID=UPI000948BA07|nr:DUF2066 domain-containing protein [Maricaulis sp. W15]OLF77817.1 hypothetical protein AWH62_03860 [Maricaulis sp. W15]